MFPPRLPEPLTPGRPKGSELRAEQRIIETESDYPVSEEDMEREVELEDDMRPEQGEESPAVRVYPVAAPPRERMLVTWEAGTLDVDTADTTRVTQIASRHSGRKRLVVRNMSLDANVYLVPTRETLYFLGFKLNAGQDIELLNSDDVWAYAEPGGNPATVTFMAEYEVEETTDTENG
jgi:hypothetical protein